METTIIINEQHKLLSEQESILKETFGTYSTLLVPSNGWNKQYRDSLCKVLTGNIVFVSPIPGMILDLAVTAALESASTGKFSVRPWVFSNDTREKRELPNGTIINTVAKTGWYLE